MAEANEIVALWHSHHKPVKGHRFSIAADSAGRIVGVVIVGRPVARRLDDGYTFEVTRLCTNGHPNAASKLLGASWRASRAMGVRKLVSYTRADEEGICYRAAGWKVVAQVKGREWDDHTDRQRRQFSLPGIIRPTTQVIDRVRWEIAV